MSRQASARTHAAERQDGAGLLGERDEVVRAEQAAGRVAPADERLDADRSGRWRARRSAGSRRRARRGRRSAPAPRSARGGRRSPRASSARRPRTGRLPAALARVHRDVGVAQQLVGAGSMPVACAAGDPDAGADRRSPGPAIWNGIRSASMIRWATAIDVPRGPARPRAGSRTRRRPGGPPGRSVADASRGSAPPTATSSRSPAAWPSVSLTTLKSSRSRNRTTGDAVRRPRPSSRSSTCSTNSAPVRQAGQRVVIGLVAELLLEPRQLGQRLLELAVLERDRGLVGERLEQAQVVAR